MFDAAPTPLDLNFRLFGFPVRVSPWFWLVTVMFWTVVGRNAPVSALLLWVGCLFGSILLHELGHAVLLRRYGAWAVRIVLHGFGGLAIPDRLPTSRWQRIFVYLAGPGVQLLLFAVLYGSQKATGWAQTNEYAELLYTFLVVINLFWALVNLLPVMPLDGGQVCREALFLLKVPRAEVKAWGVSAVTAGVVVVISLLDWLDRLPPAVSEWLPVKLHPIGILFVGLMGFQSFQMMQRASRSYSWDDGPRWR